MWVFEHYIILKEACMTRSYLTDAEWDISGALHWRKPVLTSRKQWGTKSHRPFIVCITNPPIHQQTGKYYDMNNLDLNSFLGAQKANQLDAWPKHAPPPTSIKRPRLEVSLNFKGCLQQPKYRFCRWVGQWVGLVSQLVASLNCSLGLQLVSFTREGKRKRKRKKKPWIARKMKRKERPLNLIHWRLNLWQPGNRPLIPRRVQLVSFFLLASYLKIVM